MWFSLDVPDRFPTGSLDSRTITLLVCFSLLLFFENMVFPYEVFTLYSDSAQDDFRFLLQGSIVMASLAALIWAGVTPYLLLLAGEAGYFLWRMQARQRVKTRDVQLS